MHLSIEFDRPFPSFFGATEGHVLTVRIGRQAVAWVSRHNIGARYRTRVVEFPRPSPPESL